MPYWLTCDLSALLPLQLCVNCVSFGAWWVNDLALFSNVASGSRACKATGSLGSQWPTGGRIRELTTTTAKRAAAGEPLCFSVVLPHLGIHEFFYLATKSPAQCLRVEWTPKCVDLRRSQRTSACVEPDTTIQATAALQNSNSDRCQKRTKNSRQMEMSNYAIDSLSTCISSSSDKELLHGNNSTRIHSNFE